MKFRNIGLTTGINVGVIMTVIGLLITQVAMPSLDWNDGGGGLTVIISLFFYGLIVAGGYVLVAIGLGLILISVIGWASAKLYSTLGAKGKKRVQIGLMSVIVLGLVLAIVLYIDIAIDKIPERSEPVAKVYPEGPFTLFHKNGQKMFEGSYDNNSLIQGPVTAWYESGQKKFEMSVTDGMLLESSNERTDRFETFSGLDGRAAYWYENGQMGSEEFYVDNRLDGLNRAWRQDGTLQWEIHYKDDGTATWKCSDEEGRQKMEFGFVETRSNVVSAIPGNWEQVADLTSNGTCRLPGNVRILGFAGLSHGTWKVWHYKDDLSYEEDLENGKKHSAVVRRISSGAKMVEENYEDGMQHGTSRRWWDNGQLQYDSIYENGILIKTDAYSPDGVRIDLKTGQPIE